MPQDPRWEEAMYAHFRELGREAILYVETAAKDAGIEVETLILEGHPAEEILNFTEKKDIYMIVVGSLGKTDIERFLLGSVSENIVKDAKVPVLVVRAKRP